MESQSAVNLPTKEIAKFMNKLERNGFINKDIYFWEKSKTTGEWLCFNVIGNEIKFSTAKNYKEAGWEWFSFHDADEICALFPEWFNR